MKVWSLTLHGPGGILSQADSQEAQFVLGTEEAPDVLTVAGEGVASRHAWVWVADERMQVEDLAGGTLVNGHPIEGRVEAEYPASVQVGAVTLVVEPKAVAAELSVGVTIPQRTPTKTASSTDVKIPQRTPALGGNGNAIVEPQTASIYEAPLRGKYTLVREIARGGMGQIYFGEDPQLERQVAVKVSSISEGGEDARFSKEAKVLAQLAHPNIVPIHAIGVDSQGRPFYSMKLVKGRTLQAVLNAIREGDAAAVREYPRATLLTIFRKVCDAMAFAHAQGVLHRDLKPENIMVGEYGEVLVMDWGLAKVLGGRDDVASGKSPAKDTGDYGVTVEGEVMGTPQYMSPEQAEGMVAELDARSDIYSLGGILYAILTQRPPVEGKTLNEVLTKVKKGEISSMATKRGGKGAAAVGTPVAMGVEVPEALQAVTLKAMATDRTKRYESVEVFAADIEAYQNGFATSAEEAGAFRQLALFIKRNKGVSAAVGLLLVAAMGFTAKLAASERVARASEARALGEMEKSRRSEAEAQMVLAESAYSAGNADQMRQALSKVPEDLRSQVWRYLEERIVGGDASALPEDGSSWMGLEPNPLQSGAFFAIRSDGVFCSIEGETGNVKVLWKTGVDIPFEGQFSVSKDASVMAFFARAKNSKDRDQIQVRRVGDGTLLRAFHLPRERRLTARLWVSQNHLVAQLEEVSGQKANFLSAWSTADGRLIWELPQRSWDNFVSFSVNSAEVCVFNSEGFLQRIEADSGKVLLETKSSIGRGSRHLETYDGSPDLKRFVMTAGGSERVRVFSDAWNEKLQADFASSFRIASVAFLPGTDFLLTLCSVSDQAGCLEVRDCKQAGKLVRSLPFSTPKVRWYGLNSLRCSGAFAGLLLPDRIRIWNFSETPPFRSFTHVGGNQFAYTVLSSNGTQVLGIKKGEKQAGGRVEAVRLFDVAGGWEFPKEIGKVLLPPSTPGGAPSLGGGLEDRSLMVEFDRNGRRCLLQHNGAGLALAIESGELKNLWGEPKRLLSSSAFGKTMLIHPDADLLWTGDSVVEFSTGRELRRMNRGQLKYYGTGHQKRVSWLGSTRVVEECPLPLKNEAGSGMYESNRLVLWDTESGEPIADEHSPYGFCISVSPDGDRLAEGCSDTRVRFRNVKTLAVESEFRAHDSPVKSIEFHPVLPILATLSATEVRFWDLKDGRMLEEIRLRVDAPMLRFVAGGRMVHIWGMLFEPKSCAP